jgi:uncharacterized membrane protein required for colicin V production
MKNILHSILMLLQYVVKGERMTAFNWARSGGMKSLLIDGGVGAILLFFVVMGFRRGAWPSGFVLVGTLIGTVLVDLWHDGVVHLLTPLALASGWPLFLALSCLLLIAVVVGYGADTIFEFGLENATEWSHRLIGAAIGLVNAALLTNYLVRYAREAWPDPDALAWLTTATITSLVIDLLPWGMLALTLAGLLILLFRLLHTIRSEQELHADRPASPQEADRRVLERINQALGHRRR